MGEVIRVVKRPGAHHDYMGFGPFGDGTFSAAEKGLPVETVSGQATITAVDGDAVTLGAPLPVGDGAYRASADAWAGHPGFAFARVLVDPSGARMVPHFRAVDVASDNRILAGGSWTTTHTFADPCAEPTVEARLVGRAIPLRQSQIHGWALRDTTITTLSQ